MSLLHAWDLYISYHSRPVLQGVDVTLQPGEVLGIIGANGAGKTTLLRALAGLLEPQSGKIMLDGRPLRGQSHVARHLAYLDQHTSCHWPLAAYRLVELGRLPHLGFGQRMRKTDRLAVRRAMREADVLHLRRRPVTELSTGEQARVFLARALAVEPRILLADEPVAGLDPAHQLGVMELLLRKAGEGMAVVAILHDLALATRYCHRLLLLHEGKVLALGAPQEVLTADNLRLAMQVTALSGEYDGIPYILPWSLS